MNKKIIKGSDIAKQGLSNIDERPRTASRRNIELHMLTIKFVLCAVTTDKHGSVCMVGPHRHCYKELWQTAAKRVRCIKNNN